MATDAFPTGPDGPETGKDVAAATAIFAQWQVYESIIDRNFMRHREIGAAIGAFAKGRFRRRFSLLDLGCGDATSVPPHRATASHAASWRNRPAPPAATAAAFPHTHAGIQPPR